MPACRSGSGIKTSVGDDAFRTRLLIHSLSDGMIRAVLVKPFFSFRTTPTHSFPSLLHTKFLAQMLPLSKLHLRAPVALIKSRAN